MPSSSYQKLAGQLFSGHARKSSQEWGLSIVASDYREEQQLGIQQRQGSKVSFQVASDYGGLDWWGIGSQILGAPSWPQFSQTLETIWRYQRLSESAKLEVPQFCRSAPHPSNPPFSAI